MCTWLYPDKQHQKKRSNAGFPGLISTAESYCLLTCSVFFFILPSNVQGDSQTSICITIEPGLLLKGDILVRTAESCYPKTSVQPPNWKLYSSVCEHESVKFINGQMESKSWHAGENSCRDAERML